MASSQFTALMKEFGSHLDINLDPEEEDHVALTLPDGCHLLIVEVPQNGHLLVRTVIGDVDAGPHRVNVLRSALLFNNKLPPRAGTFEFSDKKSQLSFYKEYNFDKVTAESLLDDLADFSNVATTWSNDLRQGRVPEVKGEEASQAPSRGGPGLFGLRP